MRYRNLLFIPLYVISGILLTYGTGYIRQVLTMSKINGTYGGLYYKFGFPFVIQEMQGDAFYFSIHAFLIDTLIWILITYLVVLGIRRYLLKNQ